MIRIAHISDSHFDERGRLQDVIDVHRAFLQQAKAARVDAIIHAGDWFERRSTPAERIAVANFLLEAAHIAAVFGVKGNHDAAQDLDLFPRLSTLGGVQIVDRPSTLGRAMVIELDDTRRLGMIGLPWFDKAHLVAGLDVSVDQGETRTRTIEAARVLLSSLRHEATRLRTAGAIPILVGHVMVAGSEVSSGQTLIGTSVELSPADLLEVGAAYAALGHVHLTQTWFDGRVAYSGSPNRCNFGEAREAKGWRLVTLTDEGEFVSNEFVELPARRIELLEADWTQPQALAQLREIGAKAFFERPMGVVTGALVRFRYHVEAKDLHLVDGAAIERLILSHGAAEVKVEAIVQSSTRARAPEIVNVKTLAEKVDAFLEAKVIQVGEAQRERIHQKVWTLEGGAHASV